MMTIYQHFAELVTVMVKGIFRGKIMKIFISKKISYQINAEAR